MEDYLSRNLLRVRFSFGMSVVLAVLLQFYFGVFGLAIQAASVVLQVAPPVPPA